MSEDPQRRHSLRRSQLIDYPNVAAGHEGVQSSQSGDLIVKPCKNAELHFYQQTWKPDPDASELAYYMPKFYGTLNQQESSSSSATSPPTLASMVAAAASSINSSAVSPTLASPVLISPTGERRASHISNLSAPGTPKSTGSKAGHGRSPSRTSMISHVPVDESLAPTKPPKSWEPTHGKKIDADTSVVLENVAAGLRRPNILDVKIGARLWADDAHPAKRQKMEKTASETISGSHGFRFAGMKLWAGEGAFAREKEAATGAQGACGGEESRKDEHGLPRPSIRDDDYASYDKWYGRAMTQETIQYGLQEYFYRPQAGIKRSYAYEIISRFIEDLKGFINVMEGLETRMYSASLLFVYEGDGAALREDFRREDRMLREARLRREAEEEIDRQVEAARRVHEKTGVLEALNVVGLHQAASGQDQAAVATTPDLKAGATSLTSAAFQPRSTAIQATNLPVMPSISVDNQLHMPSQLILSEDQFVEETMASDDGDPEDDDDDDEDETLLPKIQAVKLIDFAHASWAPGQGADRNFIDGVRNLVALLEEMLPDPDNTGRL